MKINETQKQIDSCKKVFSLLKLLLNGNPTLAEITDFFAKDDKNFNSNTICVTLNKYINTLKIFGINIVKDNKCFKILNPPFKIDLTEAELEGFNKLYTFLNKLDGDNFEEVKTFLNKIKIRFNEKIQINIEKENSKNETDFSFYYSNYLSKINICEKFCAEEYKVEIVYYKSGSKKENIIRGKIDKLIYGKNKIRLRITDFSNYQPISIAISKIISIKQLNNKVSPVYNGNNVVIFKLKGRLAENYTLRNWEYVDKIEDGYKIIVNKGEDIEELKRRVLKYKDSCSIVSPKQFRQEISQEIIKTINYYKP